MAEPHQGPWIIYKAGDPKKEKIGIFENYAGQPVSALTPPKQITFKTNRNLFDTVYIALPADEKTKTIAVSPTRDQGRPKR